MHDPYASGVLVKDVHARLVADMSSVAMDANIRPHWLWTSMADAGMTESEIDWVRRFKRHENAGACLIGKKPSILPEERMSAIAGALSRNFIRARVMTVLNFLDWLEDGEVPEMTCVLIPNFFIEKKITGGIAQWKTSMLQDGLMQRHAKGLMTVVYVQDMVKLGAEYGLSMQEHLVKLYDKIGI